MIDQTDNSGQMTSLQKRSSKKIATQSQETGDRISVLSLSCVMSGKPLSLNTLVCHMVTMTPSSQICSLDTIHLHYFYIFLDGGEISGEKQRHKGPVHSPEFPAPHPQGACVTCYRKEILPWSIVLLSW